MIDSPDYLFVSLFELRVYNVLAAFVNFLVLYVVLPQIVLSINWTPLQQDDKVVKSVTNLTLVTIERNYLILVVDHVQHVAWVVYALVRVVVVDQSSRIVWKRDDDVLVAVVSEENGEVCDGDAVEVVRHVLDFLNFSFSSWDRKCDDFLVRLKKE